MRHCGGGGGDGRENVIYGTWIELSLKHPETTNTLEIYPFPVFEKRMIYLKEGIFLSPYTCFLFWCSSFHLQPYQVM